MKVATIRRKKIYKNKQHFIKDKKKNQIYWHKNLEIVYEKQF